MGCMRLLRPEIEHFLSLAGFTALFVDVGGQAVFRRTIIGAAWMHGERAQAKRPTGQQAAQGIQNKTWACRKRE